jgi:hypothetical protein
MDSRVRESLAWVPMPRVLPPGEPSAVVRGVVVAVGRQVLCQEEETEFGFDPISKPGEPDVFRPPVVPCSAGQGSHALVRHVEAETGGGVVLFDDHFTFYEVGEVNEKKRVPRMAMRGGGDIPPEADPSEGLLSICRVQPRREVTSVICWRAGRGRRCRRKDQRDVTLATRCPT